MEKNFKQPAEGKDEDVKEDSPKEDIKTSSKKDDKKGKQV